MKILVWSIRFLECVMELWTDDCFANCMTLQVFPALCWPWGHLNRVFPPHSYFLCCIWRTSVKTQSLQMCFVF